MSEMLIFHNRVTGVDTSKVDILRNKILLRLMKLTNKRI